MVVELLRLREDTIPDYDEAHFVSCLQQRTRITAREKVSATGRTSFAFERTSRARIHLTG